MLLEGLCCREYLIDAEKNMVPISIYNCVLTAYRELQRNRLYVDMNPVEEVSSMVTGDDVAMFIDVILEAEDQDRRVVVAVAVESVAGGE